MSELEVERIKKRLLRQMLHAPKNKCPTVDDTGELEGLVEKCRVVVADFWAPWCGPCRLVEPVIGRLERRYGGKAAFARVNIDFHPEVASRYEVMGVPTVIVFNKGREVERFVGYSPLLYGKLDALLKRLTGP